MPADGGAKISSDHSRLGSKGAGVAGWRRHIRRGLASVRGGLAIALAAALVVGNGAAMWPACCRAALAAKSTGSAAASCCARDGEASESEGPTTAQPNCCRPRVAFDGSAAQQDCTHQGPADWALTAEAVADPAPANSAPADPAPADPCCCLEAALPNAAILAGSPSDFLVGWAPLAALPAENLPRAERASVTAPTLLANLSALERCGRLCRWRN